MDQRKKQEKLENTLRRMKTETQHTKRSLLDI